MVEFASRFEAAAPKNETPLSQQTPITIDSLLPPRTNAPRAWQRVAVASAPGHHRHGKIWKRVGGLTLASPQDGYARAVFELTTNNLVARKRSRQNIHVPKFGEAQWDPRADNAQDGKALLEEARASVARAQEEEAQTAPVEFNKKQATFPDDSLNWVPRKRNNSRWPVLSKSDMTRVVANKHPLPLPNAPEPVDIPMKAQEHQMMARSPLRPTRRISLLPGADSPRKLQVIPLSPAKESAPVLSPVKRPPLSPLKVAESPLRKFRVNATPTKIVLESPKSSPPEKSPLKSSPISSHADATLLPSVSTPKPTSIRQTDSPTPLIFDSPITEALAEPEYETHRRNSLHVARRTERKSLGGPHLSRLEALRKSPNRRHSFTSLEHFKTEAPKAVKGRRNSVDGSSPKRESLGSQKAVEVDIKANIDIFAQWPKPSTPTSTSRSSFGAEEEQQREGSIASTPTKAALKPDVQADHDQSSVPSSTEQETSALTAVTTNGEAAEGTLDQAAASPLATPQTPTPEEVDILQTELLEQSDPEDMFTPYEPEGLSTIYEESYIEPDTPLMEQKHSASVQDAGAISPVASKTPADEKERPSTPCSGGPTVGAPSTPTERTIQQSHILLDEALQLSIRNSIRKDQTSRRIPEPSSPCLSSSILEDASEVFTEDASEVSLLQESDADEPADTCGTNVHSSDSPEQKIADDSATASLKQTATESDNGQETEFCSTQSLLDKETTSADECRETTLAVPGSPSASDALCQVAVAVLETPETPAKINNAEADPSLARPEGQARLVVNTAESESSGFTPINSRHSSPTESVSFAVKALAEDSEAGLEDEDDMDADEIVEQQLDEDEDDDDVAENSSDDEFALDTEAPPPRPVNDTMQLQAMHEHDDSETEMLRKFVTRVAADKNAKVAAAAAAAALSTQSSRLNRHSGSTNPVTSSTGSPITGTDSESLTDRIPLGEKSPNSPSPVKKRKLGETSDDVAKETHDPSPEQPSTQNSNPQPVLKKRRKLGEPFSGTAATSAAIPPDDDDPTEEAPRRSTRTRSARSLKPSAPSANSITLSALSMIPVRLPGMGAMDDSAMDGRKSMGRLRNEEKDIAIITKTNTRKNKGAAVPPPVVLQKQQHDPSWIKLESKRVVDPTKPEGASKAKSVRWDEQLARYQESDAPFKGISSALLADVLTADASQHGDEEDELAIPTITEVPLPPAQKKSKVVAAPAAEPTRRSNRTRLQAPTPVKKVVASTVSAVSAKPASAVRPKISSTETAGSLAVRAKAAVPKSKPTTAKDAAIGAATKLSATSGKLKRKVDSEESNEESKSLPGADTNRVVKRVKKDTAPKMTPSPIPSQSKTVEPVKKTKTATATTSTAKTKSSTTKAKTAVTPARSPAGPNAIKISMAAAPPAAASRLGMGVNGTPAPRRRGRPPSSSTTTR
ncbi:hypothetical protein QBC38DRAFT_176658 [Podospora fimiseda]|uniref:Uncharacterized protein n=1 Tax=Podospora fimiseda TaxID=252190 RepID=A0AAN7BYP8_9PEZI|nr:hypothetical protein QBC38DRAFT_176658 [Podospora fimiseda]